MLVQWSEMQNAGEQETETVNCFIYHGRGQRIALRGINERFKQAGSSQEAMKFKSGDQKQHDSQIWDLFSIEALSWKRCRECGDVQH